MNRIIAIPILCFLLIFRYIDSNAKTIYLKSVNDYKKSLSILKSGDSVNWKNGIYPDILLKLSENKIVFDAKVVCKVFSTSAIRINYLINCHWEAFNKPILKHESPFEMQINSICN